MGIRFPSIAIRSLLLAKQSCKAMKNGPKGHIAVYVGEEQKKRIIVPISYLNYQWFQDLLNCAEEEFGFSHPMGGLTIPCTVEAFTHFSSSVHIS